MIDQLAALKLEVHERQKKEAKLEGQIKLQKQQMEAILMKLDSHAGTSKLDQWSLWSDADRKEIIVKKILPDKDLLGICTAPTIHKAWTHEGAGSIHKVVEIYVKEHFDKDPNSLVKLCKLMGRDRQGTFDFISDGLRGMAGNPALHEEMRQQVPQLVDLILGLQFDGPNLLEVLGHRWLLSLPSAEGLISRAVLQECLLLYSGGYSGLAAWESRSSQAYQLTFDAPSMLSSSLPNRRVAGRWKACWVFAGYPCGGVGRTRPRSTSAAAPRQRHTHRDCGSGGANRGN